MRAIVWLGLVAWLAQAGVSPAFAQSESFDPPVNVPADVGEPPPPPDVPLVPPPTEGTEPPLAESAEETSGDPGADSSGVDPSGTQDGAGADPASPGGADALAGPEGLASATSAETGTEGEVSVVNMKQAYEAANGSFSYRVDLDLPRFHGIQPDLKLVYNSSRKLTGGGESQGWLGWGWALSGLDVIERAEKRRGTPHYDADDIFLWNGEEVLPCPTNESANDSVSCKAGGTHFTKVESFRKITFAGGFNRWTITNRDGVKHVLLPVGDFMTDIADPDDVADGRHRKKYRWLLSSIVDTHGNTVNFGYTCNWAPQCYLDNMTYTGTVVDFFWEDRPDFVSYGTGAGLAKSRRRLTAVRVRHGGPVQKAFVLKYEQNPTTNLSRLASVTPYGSDVTLTATGAVIDGTAGQPHRFEYNNAEKGFNAIQYGNFDGSPGRNFRTEDRDQDWTDTLIKYTDATRTGFPSCSTGSSSGHLPDNGYVSRENHYMLNLNTDRSLDHIKIKVIKFGGVDEDQIYDEGEIRVTATSRDEGGYHCSTTGYSDTREHEYEIEYGIGDATSRLVKQYTHGQGQTEGDYDGDGTREWEGYNWDTGDTRVIFSSGGTINLRDIGGLAGDVNGDGLTDLVSIDGSTSLTVKVYLSTGRGFMLGAQTTSPIAGRSSYPYSYPYLADLNGDGRPELMVQNLDNHLSHFAVLLRDGAVVPQRNWSVTLPAHEVDPDSALLVRGDLNGDAMTDFMRDKTGGIWRAKGPVDNLLVRATNSYGAEIKVEYKPSTAWKNERMGSIEQTVSAITVKDGRTAGDGARSEFNYADGRYDFEARRFLGFATETETRPCIGGEREGNCPTISRARSQRLGAIGTVTAETFRDGTGKILKGTRRELGERDTAEPYVELPVELLTYHYVQAGSPAAPERCPEADVATCLFTRTVLGHDGYGNLVSEQDLGRSDAEGDERLKLTTYKANADAYIVSKKASESTYGGRTVSAPLLSYGTYRYDGAPTHLTPPSKGALTVRHVRASGDLNAFELFSHDERGNITVATNPVSGDTTWVYDALDLYPISETNPVGHVKTTTWNFPCGLPALERDVNELQTRTEYDDFCRKLRVTRSASGAYEAFEYADFGDPAVQSVITRRPHPNGGDNAELYTRSYFDGLGRVWQSRAKGLTPQTPTLVTRSFDARGNLASETLPRFAGGTALATTFSYDKLDRLIKETRPDGEVRTHAHDIDSRGGAGGWMPLAKVTTTDELDRKSVVVSDAGGRPIEITRYLGTRSVVEKRRYDALGRLLGLTDPGGSDWSYAYDMRGLRTMADDPDLGRWFYQYDRGGRLVLQTDARRLETTLSYDRSGRLLTKSSERPDHSLDVITNRYDQDPADQDPAFHNVGRLTTATSEHDGVLVGTQSFDHDREGRLARQSWIGGAGNTSTAETGYAPGGEVLWRSFPDGDSVGSAAAPWVYDDSGRLRSVPGVVASTTYEADGQTASIRYPNGVTTTFAYDPRRRWLDRVEHRSAAETLMRLDYTRDQAGRIKAARSF